ncbi:MAG: polyprenyl diphosphate synthase [Actinocatenispora sp.]
MSLNLRGAAYALYARRLRTGLAGAALPQHVALIMDGNRRWARAHGFANASVGHRYGAEHVDEVLDWCADLGIRHVTVFAASADNLSRRDAEEVRVLVELIERSVRTRHASPANRWRLRVAGRLDLLPRSTADALTAAQETTGAADTDSCLTLAIGYGGREELVDAFRSLLGHEARHGTTLTQLAGTLTAEHIAAHLYTAGQPDPDLVIRTSGEQRLSGFLLWQSAYSELYFCDVYWPGFRQVDFLRALRSYASRHRRFGS